MDILKNICAILLNFEYIEYITYYCKVERDANRDTLLER